MVLLVDRGGWAPLLANVAGWVVAMVVSYSGHRRLSFRHSGATAVHALPRFVAVSATGFAVNETAYALVLRWGGWRYDIVLAVVLVAVATLTYLASRYWVFVRSPGR